MSRPALVFTLVAALSAPCGAAMAAHPARSRPPSAAPAAAPVISAAATIAELKGSANVLLDGVEPWTEASKGMQLTPGTQVRTGAGSMTLLFFDGSKVRLERRTEFTLESAERSDISIVLGLGKLTAWVAKLKGRRFQTRSPGAVAAVRGTTYDQSTDGETTKIDLFQGSLGVTDAFGRSALLSSGQRVEVNAAGATGAAPANAPLQAQPLPPNLTAPPEPQLAMLPPPPPGAPVPGGEPAPAPGPAPNAPPAGAPAPDANMPPPPPNPTQNNQIVPVSPSAP